MYGYPLWGLCHYSPTESLMPGHTSLPHYIILGPQEHIEELEASNPAGARSPKAMAAELESLRKELAKARRMNEILKKTVGYFSKED